ncbi:MAG: hypothetical protein QM760_13545 [Nibricoccus sp.]
MTPPPPPADQTPIDEPPARFSAHAVDHFAPSWKRLLVVALLAFGSFFIPQEIALEWYPLNEPGNDIHYLEATLRTSNTGTIRILYDCGFGFVEPYSITIPVAPSDMAFTYTFPLPDAPIRKIFIDPPDAPGELEFTRFRIINRREEEVRSFSSDEFKISQGLQLQPTLNGWKLVATAGTSFDAGADVDFLPVRPVGMTLRNVKRCLLSWSYLSFMLWLIVLAIYFVFLNHLRGKDILKATSFLLLICCFISVVGNRGLIKNTKRIAYFKPVKVPPGAFTLETEIAAEKPTDVQLSITAPGQPAQLLTATLSRHTNLQTIRFPLTTLPADSTLSLHLPDGSMKLMPLRLRDGGKYTVLEIPVVELAPPKAATAATTAGVPFIQLPSTNSHGSFDFSKATTQKIAAQLTAPPRITP